MICIAAAIVFGILAIFSAKYRSLAGEAWSCVFRKVTLRPCQSGLDRRMRTGAMLAVGKKSPKLGKVVYKIFPFLSFLFVLLTVVSFGYLVYGGYNFALYGNCNGPGSTGFCIFDPNGPESSGVEQCTESPHIPEALLVPLDSELTDFKTFNPGEKTTVIFIGCYSCHYTREASGPLLDAIEKFPDVTFVLVDFPLPNHEGSIMSANAANCVYDQNPSAYTNYARLLYSTNLSQGLPRPNDVESWSIDFDAVDICSAENHERVVAGQNLGTAIGVYGTPTYFIGGKAYVGPLNARALSALIKKAR